MTSSQKSQSRFWIACQPDISKPIGGVKQLHRLAEVLESLGHEAWLIQDSPQFHPGWFQSAVKTTTRSNAEQIVRLKPANDFVIMPETYVEAFETYFPQSKKIIFNQNFSYTFKGRKGLLRPDALLRHYCSETVCGVWCVSDYDESCLLSWLGPRSIVSRIVNSIDTDVFRFQANKKRLIAYMSRKNPEHSAVIRNILENDPAMDGWSFLDINRLSQQQTANVMANAAIFMAFGFPEGFGLPIAEAIASGCAVVGYSGLGGRELFSLAGCFGCAEEIDYGDLTTFVDAIVRLTRRYQADPASFMKEQRRAADEVAINYSAQCMRSSVQRALAAIGCC